MALSLALAYGMRANLPFIAPIFALFLTAAPKPPMGPKDLVGVLLLVLATTSIGLLLVPLLLNYPASAFLMVLLGLYLSNYISINLGKGPVGTFLTIGMTVISVAGLASFALALAVVHALIMGIVLAIICQWIIYPLFPEDAAAIPEKGPAPAATTSNWIALRATLIVMPAYFVALTNPAMYLPLIMKSVSLGQQSSALDTRNAGRELLGSTYLGGCFAILIWAGLGIATNLWMFFLWMLLLGVYAASKIYGLLRSRFPASFWMNTVVTMLILLGSAVQDSNSGKDVYKAFAVRMSLFVVVTLYAWVAVLVLERLRFRRLGRGAEPLNVMESR
jgi:hypothetical protein